MQKTISNISKLDEQLRNLKNEFRYYQKLQEQSKYDYNHYNPTIEISYGVYIDFCNEEILRNRIRLKYLQEKIIDLRKTIKKIQREENKKLLSKHKTHKNKYESNN